MLRRCRVSVRKIIKSVVFLPVASLLGVMFGFNFHLQLKRYICYNSSLLLEQVSTKTNPTVEKSQAAQYLASLHTKLQKWESPSVQIKPRSVDSSSGTSPSTGKSFSLSDRLTEVYHEKADYPSCLHLNTNYQEKKNVATDKSFQILPSRFIEIKEKASLSPKCGTNALLNPWSFSGDNRWMIFLIKTAPKNVQRRNFIRASWGSVETLMGKRFRTIFLIGLVGSESEQKLLEEENDLFGDLLQCDLEDTYRNLPMKVLSGFRWILLHKIPSRFYTVTDDDCVMNMMNIATYFDAAPANNIICGFIYDKNCPANRNKNGKWYVSEKTYSSKIYPTFCHGGMWTVSATLLHDLYCMSEITYQNGFHLEDVYITGILREKLGKGDANIKPALTPSGTQYILMFYPWVESDKAIGKMAARWRAWKVTLPWNSKAMIGHRPVLEMRPPKNIHDKRIAARLSEKWKQLERLLSNSSASNQSHS